MKSVAVLSAFICLCNSISTIAIIKGLVIACFVFWIVAFLFWAVAFAFDSKYARTIKEYELKNYELETDALERKKRGARIRNEILSDYVIDQEIDEPDPQVSYSISFYAAVLFINILLGIWMVAAI